MKVFKVIVLMAASATLAACAQEEPMDEPPVIAGEPMVQETDGGIGGTGFAFH